VSIQAEIEVLDIYYTVKLHLERKKASSILLNYYIISRALVKKVAGETVRLGSTC
jgi:hypothetical protein